MSETLSHTDTAAMAAYDRWLGHLKPSETDPEVLAVLRPILAGDFDAAAREIMDSSWSDAGGNPMREPADCRETYDEIRAAAVSLGYSVGGGDPSRGDGDLAAALRRAEAAEAERDQLADRLKMRDPVREPPPVDTEAGESVDVLVWTEGEPGCFPRRRVGRWLCDGGWCFDASGYRDRDGVGSGWWPLPEPPTTGA